VSFLQGGKDNCIRFIVPMYMHFCLDTFMSFFSFLINLLLLQPTTAANALGHENDQLAYPHFSYLLIIQKSK
jgi:hypothetical protein